MYAVLFVVVGVTFGIGLSILTSVNAGMVVNEDVANETASALDSSNNYTVSKASESNFVELTDVTCYDTVSQNTEISCSIADAEAGVVSSTASNDTDSESVDYSYDAEDEQAQKGTTQAIEAILTFTQWLGLIALIIVAGIIIRHVTGFGRSAGGQRRGRA